MGIKTNCLLLFPLSSHICATRLDIHCIKPRFGTHCRCQVEDLYSEAPSPVLPSSVSSQPKESLMHLMMPILLEHRPPGGAHQRLLQRQQSQQNCKFYQDQGTDPVEHCKALLLLSSGMSV